MIRSGLLFRLFVIFTTLVLESSCGVIKASPCVENQFACQSGGSIECIPIQWRCDKDRDCPDGSDELDCEGKDSYQCSEEDFDCGNNVDGDSNCISITKRCDGQSDCPDGRDEEDCVELSTRSDIILNTTVSELSTETIVSTTDTSRAPVADFTCEHNLVRCGNSTECVSPRWICDRDRDCANGADEMNCPERECREGEFNCNAGTNHSTFCITKSWRCDGAVDCNLNDADEMNCGDFLCEDFQFKCASGECIFQSWACDGDSDCDDGSDEVNCTSSTTTTEAVRSSSLITTSPSIGSTGTTPESAGSSPTTEPTTSKTTTKGSTLTTGPTAEAEGSSPTTEPTTSRTTTKAPLDCDYDQHACPDSSKCVYERWLCDGEDDCLDGWDETNCTDRVASATCSSDNVLCGNSTQCILASWVCDGDEDCNNNWDERNCSNIQCESGKVLCPNTKKCIFSSWVCDGGRDCDDGWDESNCSTTTTAAPSYTCQTGKVLCVNSSQCIFAHWVCDGDDDCTNGWDERNCSTTTTASASYTCETGKVLCQNSSQCIFDHWVCDGDDDCTNGWDESNCSTTTTTTTTTSASTNVSVECNAKEFLCKSDNRCISLSRRCNRIQDCEDLTDEVDCESEDLFFGFCRSSQVTCKLTKQCIFPEWVCDNENDCPDGSDEENCTGCAEGQLRCPGGLCLQNSSRCDGLIDCYDGSDEKNCNLGEMEEHSDGLVLASDNVPPCSFGRFRCKSDQQCISGKLVCDGDPDCSDGSDEEDCNKEPCPAGTFKCSLSGTCLDDRWKCDGVKDCYKGVDEVSCKQYFDRKEANRTSLGCPRGFFSFGRERCLHIHVFPRRWLRAKQWCKDLGAELASFDQDAYTQKRLKDLLIEKSLLGWNYWVGFSAVEPLSIDRKEVELPFWLLDGKQVSEVVSPVQSGNCFFLDHADLKTYLATDCNEHAGFICEIDYLKV